VQPYGPPDEAELTARAIRAGQKRTRIAIGCMFAALLFAGALVMVWTFLFRADSDPVYVDHGTAR
jgi:type VI protein secretion system component VasK